MIPPKSDSKWKALVTGEQQYALESLAAKIMMRRLISSIKKDSSPDNISKCVDEAYRFFEKNEKIAQSDIKQIFG